ncbi:MAG TPA: hypothetical protein VFS43_47190 [Polyangiaceae bacterium]|nr:hypothetical protein [Polyangiaceae bacterium]
MRQTPRPEGREAFYCEGPRRANAAPPAPRPAFARSALARGVIAAVASLGALWPLEPAAYAQAGAEKAGAGGAPSAGAQKTASGGGQEGGEKSGAGGDAAAAGKQAPTGAEIKVVIFVEGATSAEVWAEIEKALPPGSTTLPNGPFVESLKKQGLLPLARSIKGPKERLAATAKVHAATQSAGAQAAIVASAPAPRGGKYDVSILIVPSDSPEPLSSANATGAINGGNQSRAEALAGIVSASISGIIPPPPADPETKTEDIAVEQKDPEKPKEEPKPPPPLPASRFVRGKFLFEGGIGTQGRSFFYIFPVGLERGTNVPSYKLLASPHAFLRAEVYPFAGRVDSFLGNIGLVALGGASAARSSSAGGDRGDLDTTFFHFRVGPKVRIPLGTDAQAVTLTGEITYAHLDFTFTDPSGASPSFIYQSVRPGVGARVPVGPVALLFEGGFHFVTAAGELNRRFPNASVFGLDALLGVAVPITAALEGRFNLNYTRYRGNLKADLNSDTGYIAAGSVDQFFGAHLGVAVAP